ncbi:hypothetical protein F0562_010286 [Nyssa sinensis]|uniref:Uncharacterized protein n=1 Tax=Nyssa sinensis TaxID=561372 RepID=A0A5J4ZYF7_9ASTE|nr:hypothetical protein F0562_010286 [Nyssa sinensis]
MCQWYSFSLSFQPPVSARQISHPHSNEGDAHRGHENTWPMARDGNIDKDGFPVERTAMKLHRAEPLQIAGSKLPDCSHACGSCSPCRLVTVSNCAPAG